MLNRLSRGSSTSPPEDEDSGIATALAEDLKFTAAEIEGEQCPKFLLNLGRQIGAHLDRARKAEEKADQHYIAVLQLLEKAKQNCDAGGFAAFQEKFCPDLGRSRAYELKAIATGKKSIEDIRASSRERQARCRASRKVESVTVTDSSPTTPAMDADKSPAESNSAESNKTENDDASASAAARKVVYAALEVGGRELDHDRGRHEILTKFFAEASVAEILARIPAAKRDQLRDQAVDDFFDDELGIEAIFDEIPRNQWGELFDVCIANLAGARMLTPEQQRKVSGRGRRQGSSRRAAAQLARYCTDLAGEQVAGRIGDHGSGLRRDVRRGRQGDAWRLLPRLRRRGARRG